jgi:RNA polymerase sigma-70 factor (ECF subfamily)
MNSKPARAARPVVRSLTDEEQTHLSDFAEVYRHELPRLRYFFRARIRKSDDAVVMAHDALARFLTAARSTLIESPGRYLTRIATNMAIDHAKSGANRFEDFRVSLDEAADQASDDDVHRTVEIRLEAERWREILQRLPPLALDVYLLNRIEGHTYSEVARILDISVWRVQKQMLKALRHIELHADGDDV